MGGLREKNGLHGHTGARMACMATQGQEWPAWPHRDSNGLHGHTGLARPDQSWPDQARYP